MPTECPVTGAPLEVTRLECPTSGVVIEGRFEPNEFALLPKEHLDFMRLFIKVRGNLKEIERVMGLSYPTIRSRFDGLLKSLGYEATTDPGDERTEIIDRLEKGEISAEEATKRLKDLHRKAG
jgi:hypothetical protein